MDKKCAARRNRDSDGWCVPDADHAYFKSGFANGIMIDVVFIHKAVPMVCVAGYESTGEAIGSLRETDGRPEMPSDMTRTAEVVYDRGTRRFHVKGKPKEIVDKADCLILTDDGSSVAGWKS